MPGSPYDLAGVVLGAGAGTRLRPLTDLRPKVLCPINNVAMIDLALEAVGRCTTAVAANVHHHRRQLLDHLDQQWPDVHASIEHAQALGTAGAIGALGQWLGGRPVLIANGDAYRVGGLAPLVEGWDGQRPRLLVVRDDTRGDFGPWRFAGASLLPGSIAAQLDAVPSGLYEACWRDAEAAGTLQLVEHEGTFIDCGTPGDYLAANLHASGGSSVVGPAAVVDGTIDRCVVWEGAVVTRGEHLREVIRAGDGDRPITVAASAG